MAYQDSGGARVSVKPHDGNDGGTASGRYAALEEFRRPYLDRARECAEVTIPSLVPPEGFNHTMKLYTPYQGVGARGLNNLASKLLLTLMPPNAPFFRFRVDEYAADAAQDEKAKTRIEKGLAKMERAILVDIETTAIRVPFFESLKQLLVAGNVLTFNAPDGGMRVFHLDRYVVKRDPMGRLLEAITREDLSPGVLPELLPADFLEKLQSGDSPIGDSKTCQLYTHIKRVEGHWKIYQEIKGLVVPGSRGTYPLDKSPWMALRFSRIDGEDYGRGYCEEYLGDLKSLEGLAQAILEGSIAAAKVLFLCSPNGTTSMRDLAQAPNGAFRQGNAEEVTVLRVEKANDFQIAAQSAGEIEKRLSYAFLLNSSVQRNGDRVTAEEIRYMAAELEDALGGFYSILSVDWQLPLVVLKMAQMQRQGRLPRLPKGLVRPTITTGLEALGRGHDLNKLNLFLKGANEALGPEVVARHVNVSDYLDRLATALGIDSEGLILDEATVMQNDQMAQMQALIAQLGPNAINQFGNVATKSMEQSGSPALGGGDQAIAAVKGLLANRSIGPKQQ